MKVILALAAGALVTGIFALQSGTAFAQSDRTLGINCTVAGHIHCGEDGPSGRSSYRWRQRYGAYDYAPRCRTVHQRVEAPSGKTIDRPKRICR